MLKFLNSTPARVVTLVLVAQGALLYSSIRPEAVPPGKPLADFPKSLGAWNLVAEGVVEPEIAEVLKADDLLNRTYWDSSVPKAPNLFIASFRSQRNGKTPHSPKNCLPGSGWQQLSSEDLAVDVGLAAPIVVNHYVIEHGNDRQVVLYWYQSRDRVVANEYTAKFWVIADAIRLNRTDTALVRVIVPIGEDRDENRAAKTAIDFVKAFYRTIRLYLPS